MIVPSHHTSHGISLSKNSAPLGTQQRIQVKRCAERTANRVFYFGIKKCCKHHFAVLIAQKPV